LLRRSVLLEITKNLYFLFSLRLLFEDYQGEKYKMYYKIHNNIAVKRWNKI